MSRIGIVRLSVAAIGLWFLHAGSATAELPPAGGVSGEKVYVAIDDDAILSGRAATMLTADDGSAIVVSAMLTAAKNSTWPSITTSDSTSYEQIIDKYYDYYPSKFPKTVALLREAIRSANPGVTLVPGSTIRLPPVPVKPFETWNHTPVVRMYSPTDNGTGTAGRSIAKLTFSLNPVTRSIPAGDLDVERGRGVTVFEFASAEDSYAAFPAPVRDLLGSSFSTWVAFGLEQNLEPQPPLPVDFYAGEPSRPEDALPESPYAGTRSVRLGTADLTAMKAEASRRHLLLVDWNFNDGHGRKVYDTAVDVLLRLGLCDLEKYIETIDLDPSDLANEKRLADIIKI